MTLGAPRRLPIDIVVKRSFLYPWESRAILAIPFTIYAVVTILAELLLVGAGGAKGGAALYLLSAAEQLFAIAFAVGLHRFVLLGEMRPGFGFFRWDRHFIRYVMLTLLFVILAMAAAIIVMGAVGSDNGAGGLTLSATGELFGLAVALGVALMLSRLALALPAAALGDAKRPRDIWQATEGNSLRLLAATLLTALPLLIAELAIAISLPGSGGGLVALLSVAVQGLLSAVQLTVVTVMLSLAYDVLIRGGGPPGN